MRGSFLCYPKFSLQLVKFLLSYAMRIITGMFPFVFWVFSTQKCEAVIFTKFGSACMYARPLDYYDAPGLLTVHPPCTHAHVMHVSLEL